MTQNLKKNHVISETEKFIKNYFTDEFTGHDWWHIYRVRNLAIKIATEEGGNLYLIEMAALLHDLDDCFMKNYYY